MKEIEEMTNQASTNEMPSVALLEEALENEYYKRDYYNAIRSTVFVLITVTAIALLIATLILPVIRIYGSAMEPTINDDSIILCSKTSHPERGNVLVFYYNNKIVIRRVIGVPGDKVSIDANGRVSVNEEHLNEPYVDQYTLGKSDLVYPFEVPEGQYFVLADNRTEAIDSRVSLFGCIKEEDFIGRAIFSVWPLDSFGRIR